MLSVSFLFFPSVSLSRFLSVCLSHSLSNNFMTIHPQKTKYMIITMWQKHQRIPLSNVSITINKQPIESVSHIKYLGVIVDNVFKAACVLPLQSLTGFQRSLLIIKSINDKVPQYIKSLFTLCPNGNNRFRLPLPRLDIYKSHSISFSAVMSWNSLPINIRSSMRSISLNEQF